ncbi:MAG: glutamyl-tRNA reductase [Phycisphaerae bacterium]|nr:glutamyl-tRNA reductase [Phycisphaerae bacterium]
MIIAVVGCNHRTAPVHVRERLAFDDEQAAEALGLFTTQYPDSEAVILSTCNRTELYMTRPRHGSPGLTEAVRWLAEQRQLAPEDISAHLYHHEQSEAVEHLFRVVSSLDSMVIGESQILNQSKRALAVADRRRASGSVLHGLFTNAFAVAKEVHATTAIGQGHLSVGSVALDFAGRVFSHFDDKTVLMIGAGEMGELTLRHLLTKNPRQVWVTNRTFARAEELAKNLGAQAKAFERMEELVAASDIVIASTASPEPLLTVEKLKHVPAHRKFRPLLLIDLGIPRNIDPELGKLENFYVYDIDDLQRITDEHWEERQAGVIQGERLIQARVVDFFQDRARREAGPTITALRKRLHEIMEHECEWAMPKLKTVDQADRKLIEQMMHRTVHKILHMPTKVLNGRAAEGKAQIYADALKQLFDLPDEML